MRAKAPGIDTSKYSKPANLPGLLVELMLPPLFVRGLVKGSTEETPKAAKVFRHTSKRRLLWALGERLLPSTLRVTAIASQRLINCLFASEAESVVTITK